MTNPPPRVTISQAAKAANVSRQRVLALAQQGRIPGARQDDSGRWSLPHNWTTNPAPKRPGRALDKL